MQRVASTLVFKSNQFHGTIRLAPNYVPFLAVKGVDAPEAATVNASSPGRVTSVSYVVAIGPPTSEKYRIGRYES